MKSRKNEIFHSKVKNQLRTDVNAAIAEFKKMIATEKGAAFFMEMMEEWHRRQSGTDTQEDETC